MSLKIEVAPKGETSGDNAGTEVSEEASQSAGNGLNLDGSLTLDLGEGGKKPEAQEPAKAVPEGFKDQAEYDSWLADALKARNSPKETAAAPKPEKTNAEKVIETAQLDMKALGDEWNAQGGKLTDKTMTDLKAKGITPEMIQEYASAKQAAAKAEADAFTAVLHKQGGGEEQVAQMFKWAGANMEAEQINEINDAFNSMNPARAKLAMKLLMNEYAESVGTKGKLLNTGVSAARDNGIQGFASEEEMVAAMRDPRYKKDEGYRAQVAKRLERSSY